MNKIHRIGVIGCGGISTWHIRGILDSPDLEVGALCDVLPARLEEKTALCGASADMCYDDYIKLMESGKVDAVSICTPNNVHYEIAMAAAERGIPFAVEKPLCISEAQAASLLERVESAGVRNMVCFSYRFRPAARYFRQIVSSGELGKIYHISGEYFQAWGLPGARSGGDTPLVWRYIKEIAGSGALGDLGSHMIDLLRFLTGREFSYISADMDTFITRRKLPDLSGKNQGIEVNAVTDESVAEGVVDVDDYINIVGQMQDKLAATLSISRYAYSRGNYQRVEVYGERGALRYTLENKDTLEVNIGNEPMRTGHIWAEVPVPPSYAGNQMQSFADILNGRGDGLAATVRDGWAVQRVIDAALKSAENGVRVVL